MSSTSPLNHNNDKHGQKTFIKHDGSILYCKFLISAQHANYMEVQDLVDGAAHGQVSRDILPALCAGLYRTRVYVSFGFQNSGHSKSKNEDLRRGYS